MKVVAWPRALVVLMVLAAAGPVAAQQCSSDFQCSPGAGSINVCLGDTLLLKQRRCVAGRCQEAEVGRIDCGTSGGGTCQGNTFVRAGGRCDALAGRCAPGGGFAVACVKSCSCVGRNLTISTGMCTPGAGCGRVVQRCKVGCTCSPEPRCIEDPGPEQAPGTAPQIRVRPRSTSQLPQRVAEPFEPEQPAEAVPPPAEKIKSKRKRRSQ